MNTQKASRKLYASASIEVGNGNAERPTPHATNEPHMWIPNPHVEVHVMGHPLHDESAAM